MSFSLFSSILLIFFCFISSSWCAATAAPVVGACVGPFEGLKAFWPGDDSTEDLIGKSSGSALPGLAFVNAYIGKGFSTGKGGMHVFGNPDQISILPGGEFDGFTLDMWVRPNLQTSPSETLLEFFGRRKLQRVGNVANVAVLQNERAASFQLGAINGKNVNPRFAPTSNDNLKITSPDKLNLVANTFNHIAFTVQFANNGKVANGAIFVNGSLFAPLEPVVNVATQDFGLFDLFFGTQNVVNGKFAPIQFNGVMDEIAFHARALKAAEIKSVFDAGVAGYCRTGIVPKAPGPVIDRCLFAPAGLTNWWQAEDSLNDTITNNTASQFGTVKFVNGKVGKAFDFKVGGVSMQPDQITAVYKNPTFGFEAWVSLNGVIDALGNSWAEFRDGDNFGPQLRADDQGLETVVFLDAKNAPERAFCDQNLVKECQLKLNTLVHIGHAFRTVVVEKFKFQRVSLYINGFLVDDQFVKNNNSFNFNDANFKDFIFYLGFRAKFQKNNETVFPGVVDEFGIYETAPFGSDFLHITQVGKFGKCNVNDPAFQAFIAGDQLAALLGVDRNAIALLNLTGGTAAPLVAIVDPNLTTAPPLLDANNLALAIFGGVFGGIACLVILIVAFAFFSKRNKEREALRKEVEDLRKKKASMRDMGSRKQSRKKIESKGSKRSVRNLREKDGTYASPKRSEADDLYKNLDLARQSDAEQLRRMGGGGMNMAGMPMRMSMVDPRMSAGMGAPMMMMGGDQYGMSAYGSPAMMDPRMSAAAYGAGPMMQQQQGMMMQQGMM